MNSGEIRQAIRQHALDYAGKHGLTVDESRPTAILFQSVKDNLHPASYAAIERDPVLLKRTEKPHQNVPGLKEMQSSNSSDALLMSIFCHPKVSEWKGVKDLLNVSAIEPKFGFPAEIALTSGRRDQTEIDLVLESTFVEAKLTEEDFTSKSRKVVEAYKDLAGTFDVAALTMVQDHYGNYQIIRNLLAVLQHEKRHILICDERRPDLVRSYYKIVLCLKSVDHRKRCRVIFWQEIARVCGRGLRSFLAEKYGIA